MGLSPLLHTLQKNLPNIQVSPPLWQYTAGEARRLMTDPPTAHAVLPNYLRTNANRSLAGPFEGLSL